LNKTLKHIPEKVLHRHIARFVSDSPKFQYTCKLLSTLSTETKDNLVSLLILCFLDILYLWIWKSRHHSGHAGFQVHWTSASLPSCKVNCLEHSDLEVGVNLLYPCGASAETSLKLLWLRFPFPWTFRQTKTFSAESSSAWDLFSQTTLLIATLQSVWTLLMFFSGAWLIFDKVATTSSIQSWLISVSSSGEVQLALAVCRKGAEHNCRWSARSRPRAANNPGRSWQIPANVLRQANETVEHFGKQTRFY